METVKRWRKKSKCSACECVKDAGVPYISNNSSGVIVLMPHGGGSVRLSMITNQWESSCGLTGRGVAAAIEAALKIQSAAR